MYFDFDIREKVSAVELAVAKKFNESEENRNSLKALVKVMFRNDIKRAGLIAGREDKTTQYTREDVSRYLLKRLSEMLDAEIVNDVCFAIEEDRMREKVLQDAKEKQQNTKQDPDKNRMPVL